MKDTGQAVTIVIAGASGDLAQRKVLPALFALHAQNLLPRDVNIFGFARTPMSHAEFRARTAGHLTCRYTPQRQCADRMNEFLARCYYQAGDYGAREAFEALYTQMRAVEPPGGANRLFYLAVPPSVFSAAIGAIGGAGLVACGPAPGWSRVVVEKPFGRDRASSDALAVELGRVFTEEQIYRMDHYLGKEVIQNLMVLRFANIVFEPLWNRSVIRHVAISLKETAGVEGRGGYFDGYGIVRDVMQNHLLQMLALMAMEPPAELTPARVREEKVRVLRAVAPLDPADIVVGQYGAAGGHRGYLEEEGVRPGSIAPTYAAAVLRIGNRRWKGVPFLLRAGKAVDEQLTEIRIRFRKVDRNLFCPGASCPPSNELVIRVQPDAAIFLRIVNRVPGLAETLEPTELNLRYAAAFKGVLPEAYESLLLDVLRGEKSLFVGPEELAAAWDLFDPVLRATEASGQRPEPYAFGSRGPAGAAALLARHGIDEA